MFNLLVLFDCGDFLFFIFILYRYAILSSADTTCNSSTSTSIQTNTINAALVVTLIISTSVLLYCIFFGTALLNLFNTQTEYSVLSSPLISDQADSSSTGSQSRLTGIERVRNDGNYGTSADTDEGRGGGRSSSNNNNKYENVFFHTLMMLFACYGAMVLTSWDTTDSPITSTATTNTAVSTESMWLKIVSQWVFLLTYYRTMQLAYYENS